MDAFDEWCKVNHGPGTYSWERVGPLSHDELGLAEQAWKAALKWISIKCKNYDSEDVLYFIGNELENKK